MTTVPTYTAADDYHNVRQTKDWLNLGDSTKVAVQKQKIAALTKAMDYITSMYTIMVGSDPYTGAPDDGVQSIIDAKVQTACIMLAPYYAKISETLEWTPEKLQEELRSGDDWLRTWYAVDQTGFRHQEKFPFIKSFLEPVLASETLIRIAR